MWKWRALTFQAQFQKACCHFTAPSLIPNSVLTPRTDDISLSRSLSVSLSTFAASSLLFFFLSSFRGFIIASCQNVLSELIAGNKTGHACPSLAHQWMQQMWQIGDNGQRAHMAHPWCFFFVFFLLFLSSFLLNSTSRVGPRAETTHLSMIQLRTYCCDIVKLTLNERQSAAGGLYAKAKGLLLFFYRFFLFWWHFPIHMTIFELDRASNDIVLSGRWVKVQFCPCPFNHTDTFPSFLFASSKRQLIISVILRLQHASSCIPGQDCSLFCRWGKICRSLTDSRPDSSIKGKTFSHFRKI